MSDLAYKIIIVTGGNGLLGKEIINHSRSLGATVINADVNIEDDLENDQINCDITCEESIINLLSKVISKYGKIDGFVNNAYPRTNDWGLKFEEIKIESWKKNVDMQMNTIFIISRNVLEIMKKQKYGSLINIASIYGIVGPNFNVYEGTEMTMPAAYSAIKGGIINFTRYLASYYGKHNIRINCVSPGGIFDNQHPTFVKNYSKNVPLNRMGRPEEISPTVSFLLSNESSYITGQNIIIDGGLTSI
jgi:NAD(P)-dependent dehydrogenase (short-subunit alcohol dehydrogenase family)